MTHSILITQCLQNDFVKPIGPYDSLPNIMHIGHQEARRLMGEDPTTGPVSRIIQWAYAHPENELSIVHIRDWHDPDDPFQKAHLDTFGPHCIRETDGSEFAFDIPSTKRQEAVFNAISINDFVGTTLSEYLQRFSNRPVRVGLMGVWTEAKIGFLAYELHTRYPNMQIGVCFALTGRSSRAGHFFALDQIRKILGVTVFDSIRDFTSFLADDPADITLPVPLSTDLPKIEFEEEGDIDQIHDVDLTLLRYLFRDCRSVKFKALTGGFSGNLVLGTESVDLHGI